MFSYLGLTLCFHERIEYYIFPFLRIWDKRVKGRGRLITPIGAQFFSDDSLVLGYVGILTVLIL
jgi:hypothetical protein